jgi:hypothetical protein
MTTLPLETRKRLSVAAMMLRQPAVFVTTTPRSETPKAMPDKGPKIETREQAELRRERVQNNERKPPQVVITSKAVYVLNNSLDAVSAIPMRLPVLSRLRNWLKGE